MSKFVLKLKEKEMNHFINWNIAMKSHKYVCRSWKTDLCTCESLLIARPDPNVILNKLDKFILKCRHRLPRSVLTTVKIILFYFIYAIRLVYLFLPSFLGRNIVENYLMIGHIKLSVMAVCCC